MILSGKGERYERLYREDHRRPGRRRHREIHTPEPIFHKAWVLLIILLLLVLAMTLLSPVFLTGANISNVVVQTSVLAVLAIGQLFVILVAGIDLSVGSVLGLSTVTGAIVYTATSGAGGLLALPGHTPYRCGVRLDQRIPLREG